MSEAFTGLVGIVMREREGGGAQAGRHFKMDRAFLLGFIDVSIHVCCTMNGLDLMLTDMM